MKVHEKNSDWTGVQTLSYGLTTIEYVLLLQKRRDIKISVDLVNGVEVHAPEEVKQHVLIDTLKQKAPWIARKQKELAEVQQPSVSRELVSGEKFPYLGRQYRLKVNRLDRQGVHLGLYQGRFVAIVPSNWGQKKVDEELQAQFEQWYRTHAQRKAEERAVYYQNLMGVSPSSVRVRTQHKRWGTCTTDGHIYINWKLVMAPGRVLDYVVVHELAHLKVPEHNQHFWRKVRAVMPEYEKRKEWLRIHGQSLTRVV